eukprot:TRINITY_DN90769_c0_g1_i1.p1 TRINITY_DN90769_c0_g1~~TRINITY_DN90769_c0_g1_i1.p1  ORF type:complete len:425 (+),score=72.99 TRINITY_DN90769_c0_g1_i1:51-1325(+)
MSFHAVALSELLGMLPPFDVLALPFSVLAGALFLWCIALPSRQDKPQAKSPVASPGQASPSALLCEGSPLPGSAAEAWACRYGRYKHCGLRADPFVPDVPSPRLSTVNLDIPLPELVAGEAQSLQVFQEQVRDLTRQGKRTDCATLLRFLRARKGNIPAAEAYFRQAVAYRESLDWDWLDTHWNLEAFDDCFLPWWVRGGIIGHGLKGEIVGFERFGQSHFTEILSLLPWDVLQRLDASHMARTLAAFEEDAMRRKRALGDAILVLDLDGLSWKDCSPSAARAYGKIVSCRDMLMPNTLKHVFLIRAPGIFSAVWNTAKGFLDPVTRDKVQIVSGEKASLELLRKYMSNEIIPAYMGGGRTTAAGDPECRLLLGATGRIPLEAVERLLNLTTASASSIRDGGFKPPVTDEDQRNRKACCSIFGF